MKEFHRRWTAANQAETDAYFALVLAAFGCFPDGTPRTVPKDFKYPADGSKGALGKFRGALPGSLNASLDGQLEFFSARVTSEGIIFEILVTEE